MRIRPGIVLLLIWGIFLAAADILYLRYLQPARLGKTVSDVLHDATGLNPSIRHLSFSLVPRAGVEIHGLELHPETGHDMTISVEYCRAELSWLSLLRLKPVLRRVELVSPLFSLTRKKEPPRDVSAGSVFSSGKSGTGTGKNFSWPSQLSGMDIMLKNGTINILEEDGSCRLALTGLTLDAAWPGLRNGHADIRAERADIGLGKHIALNLSPVRLTAEDINIRRDATLYAGLRLSLDAQMNSLDAAMGHRIAAPYRYFPLPEPARLGLGMTFSLNPRDAVFSGSGELELQALFPMNSHLTPLSLTIPFSCTGPDTLDIRNMRIAFDKDRGVLNGTLSGFKTLDPELRGTLELEQFSLIRWFGFGRAMPAGLQQALDRITGLLEFRLTPQGVSAPRLVARTEGMTLEGEGACADFSHPDVTITGTLEHAQLDRIFPELGGSGKEKANPQPPALPPPALPLSNDETPAPVGYKILLHAKSADIIGLTAKRAVCLITPAQGASLDAMPQADPAAPAPRDAGYGVLLSIAADDLYGGSGKARVHLADRCRIVAEAQGIAAQAPVRALAGFSAAGGTARLETDLSFSGDTPRARLESLGGKVDVNLSDGFLSSRRGTRLACSELALNIRAKGRKTAGADNGRLPAETDFAGTWAISLKTPDWNASMRTEAALTFRMANSLSISMAPQKTSLSVEWPEGIFASPDNAKKVPALKVSGTGNVSFNLHDGLLKSEKTNLSFPGAAIRGNAVLSDLNSTPLLSADLEISATHLRRAAASLGFALPATEDPATFASAKLRSRIRMRNNEISLEDIKGSLDASSFSGTAQWRTLPRRELRADLKFDHVDLAPYLPREEKKETRSSLLPLDFLKNHDLNIMLRATRLDLFSTPLRNVSIPLSLSGGFLNIGDITASLAGGGSLRGAFHGRLEGSPPELNSRFQLLLTGVDALALSKARKQDTLLAGTGNGQMKLSARMRRWSDALTLADGTWNFSVRDGYFCSAGAEQKPSAGTAPRFSPGETGPGARTSFDILSASGDVRRGVAESKNFLLRGPMLTVRGAGTLNLATRAISADATATLLGVPEIPVRIRGTVDKPETSYQIMGAVTNTLGNIGSSTLDLVGSVLTAPFRLFTGKKTLEGR